MRFCCFSLPLSHLVQLVSTVVVKVPRHVSKERNNKHCFRNDRNQMELLCHLSCYRRSIMSRRVIRQNDATHEGNRLLYVAFCEAISEASTIDTHRMCGDGWRIYIYLDVFEWAEFIVYTMSPVEWVAAGPLSNKATTDENTVTLDEVHHHGTTTRRVDWLVRRRNKM